MPSLKTKALNRLSIYSNTSLSRSSVLMILLFDSQNPSRAMLAAISPNAA